MSFLCRDLSASCRLVITVVVSRRKIIFVRAVSNFMTALVVYMLSFLTAVIIHVVVNYTVSGKRFRYIFAFNFAEC